MRSLFDPTHHKNSSPVMGLPDCRGLYASVTECDGGAFDPDSSRTADKAGAHADVYRATPVARDPGDDG